MDEHFRLNFMELNFIVGILLLTVIQTETFSKCPDACKCAFNYTKIEKNKAICQTENSKVKFTWRFTKNRPEVVVLCKGTHYNCSDMPQFDVKRNIGSMIFLYCAPSILTCVQNFYKGPTIIPVVWLQHMLGNYTNEDIRNLDKIWTKFLYVAEEMVNSTSYLPAGVFHGYNSLISLQVTGNVLNRTRLTADTFADHRSLLKLCLSKNNIELIEQDALSNLIKLRSLIIDSNMLEFLPNKLFDNLENLREIYIPNNFLNLTLDTHAFADLPSRVEIVWLNNSKISTLPEGVFNGSSSLQSINCSMNSIELLPSKIFWTTLSLKEINFTSNQIRELPNGVFSKLQSLKKVDFSDNKIETLSGNLFSFNFELQEVYFTKNNIKHIDLDIFKSTKLKILSLVSNKLEHIVGYISSSWKIKKLYLSDNNINKFQEMLLQLTDLEYLDLSDNKIIKIMDHHIYARDSIKIDLRNNKISRIEQNTPESSKLLATNKNITVYLSKNPLECDCLSNTIIKDWYNRGWVPDFSEIVCANGDLLSIIDIHLECNEERGFVLSIESKVFGGLILTVILTVICVRLGRYIKSSFNLASRNSLTFVEEQDASKQYDIFISFAHQDGEFVTDILLPKLEYEYGQNVCVHYRDWIVGELIPDQIIQSVENSTRTIIILSKHYLISEWSKLEFRTANNLCALEGKPRVIVILLDERILGDENLDKDLKSYIAFNTYLLWSDPNFWKKLKKVLPKSRKLNRN